MHGFAKSMAVLVIIAILAAAASAVPALDHQSLETYAVGYKYPGKW